MQNKYIFLGVSLLLSSPLFAKSLSLSKGGTSYLFPLSSQVRYPIDNAVSPAVVDVDGFRFPLKDSSLAIVEKDLSDNYVDIIFSGETVEVTVAGNIASYISAEIDGAHVRLIQSDKVGSDTCGEITYRLSGASRNGSFTVEGSYKSTINLNGLTLHNPVGAAIDIENGKRINLNVSDSTDNTVSDGENGSWKGAIVCKGHLELKGKGSLNVEGFSAHAIFAKEYVEMKNLNLTVNKSVKDGINCTQYFQMSSGVLTMENVGDDGIQVDFKDTTDREQEDTGAIIISGGKVNISTVASASKCLKSEGNIEISGGDITLSASGNGLWDSSKTKTKASACLSADGDMIISDGKVSLLAEGSGGKGGSCDGALNITGGDITVATKGGVFAYVNNKENHNYTGNTDRLNSDYKSSPKGFKADGNVIISGGSIDVDCKGNGGEGIESKSEMIISDGKIKAITVDDSLNSSSTMTIKGGEVMVVSSGNDGLDSNGNMFIEGGFIRAFGAGMPECGIDVNSEEGYKLYITGGKLLGVGGSNSVPSNSQSTQPYLSLSMSVSNGQTVSLKSGSEVLAEFEIPSEYNGSTSGGWMRMEGSERPPFPPEGFDGSERPPFPPEGFDDSTFRPGGSNGGGMIISVPELVNGTSYTVTNGSSTSNSTALQYGSSGGFPR